MSETINPLDYPLPSGEAERKKFEDALEEIEKSMRRMDGEKVYIRETLKDLSKEYKIPTKVLRKICRQHVDGSYQKSNDQKDAENELYEAVFNKGAKAE